MERETLILDHNAILQRTKRIAWQIYETNSHESDIVLVGIERRGVIFSELIEKELREIGKFAIHSGSVNVDGDNPQNSQILCDETLAGKVVIVVDDVLNTGRTLIQAIARIVSENPSKLQTAILADRDHKLFPVAADFVGISLATTMQEHIAFRTHDDGTMSVSLQ